MPVRDQLLLQLRLIDIAVLIFMDNHQVGYRFAPGELVRVMLVWADEYDRPLGRRDQGRQRVAVVEVGRGSAD